VNKYKLYVILEKYLTYRLYRDWLNSACKGRKNY